MAEIAIFRGNDPDALVEASLSCPICLRRTELVAVEGDLSDGHARCCCETCQSERIVELLPEQFLRLSLTGAMTG